MDIRVEDDIYRPDDDSYMLIDMIRLKRGDSVLEIGCGSGIISIHCALAGGEVTACDIHRKAVELTRYNAERNGTCLRGVLVGDMFRPFDGIWDVIVFNPPYLPELENRQRDPRWDGGKKGDETIVEFLMQGWRYMHPGSRLYFCCSDLSPMWAILETVDRYYSVTGKKKKRFDFETLFAYELGRA